VISTLWMQTSIVVTSQFIDLVPSSLRLLLR